MKRCPLCETDYPDNHTICDRDGAALIVTWELAPGTAVRNKYRIVRTLGRGGMGTVYLADHILLGRQRALKFISRDLSQDPRILKRFRLEALAAMELRHPNVAEVFDLDQAEDGSPFIAMEFIEGIDLRHAMSHGLMDVDRSLEIVRGVALGLGAAHAKGVIHRDVKPENILLSPGLGGSETPKLLDFGIAAIKGNLAATSSTRTGLMLTPAYAAPEQWMGLPSDQIDGRADLYALGGVLNEMLTGQNGYHSHDAPGWPSPHAQAARQAPGSIRPELRSWPGLDELVLWMLAADRNQRPRDVAEFLHNLDIVRSKRGVTRVETRYDSRAKTLIETPIGAHDAAAVTAEGKTSQRTGTAKKSRAIPWIAAAAACLILGGLVWAGIKSFRRVTPQPPIAGSVRENSRDGSMYVWIPAGSFQMGCSPGDSECQPDEMPAHSVSISKAFWIGQTPVTVSAWKRYRTATNAPALKTSDSLGRTNLNEAGPENLPVILESWEQASSYCNWTGMTLPTEAQWEYAARAGSRESRYGDLDAIAWYGNNSGRSPIDTDRLNRSAGQNRFEFEQKLADNGNFAHTVGLKQPNAWHLYDTLGNVLEWINDWYSPNYYQLIPVIDPLGPQTGQTKVSRGGSWDNPPEKLRVSARTAIDPGGHFTGIGFRCVANSDARMDEQSGGDKP